MWKKHADCQRLRGTHKALEDILKRIVGSRYEIERRHSFSCSKAVIRALRFSISAFIRPAASLDIGLAGHAIGNLAL